MEKLLRNKKKFGRCPMHGGNCCVGKEIQSEPITRSKEKSDIQKEIKEQMQVW